MVIRRYMIISKEDVKDPKELSYETMCTIIEERNITAEDIMNSPLNNGSNVGLPYTSNVIESIASTLMNGILGGAPFRKRKGVETSYEQYLNTAKVLFHAYYMLDDDEFIEYETTSFAHNLLDDRPKDVHTKGGNERLRWLYVIQSLTRAEIRDILYTEYTDEKGKTQRSMDQYGSMILLKKVFKHPTFNITFPIHINDVPKFPMVMQSYKRKYYNDNGIKEKYGECIGNAYDASREVIKPYTCGYDLEYSFLMYVTFLKFNGAKFETDAWFKSTQPLISNFVGYKSHNTFKTHVDQMLAKQADENLRNTYEKQYVDVESFTRFAETYQALLNIMQGNIEGMLLNEGARNLHGAMFLQSALERGTFNETTDVVQAQEIKVTFDNSLFST